MYKQNSGLATRHKAAAGHSPPFSLLPHPPTDGVPILSRFQSNFFVNSAEWEGGGGEGKRVEAGDVRQTHCADTAEIRLMRCPTQD